jgi:hypothetical protein
MRNVTAVPATRLSGSVLRIWGSTKPECRRWPTVAVSTLCNSALSSGESCDGSGLIWNIAPSPLHVPSKIGHGVSPRGSSKRPRAIAKVGALSKTAGDATEKGRWFARLARSRPNSEAPLMFPPGCAILSTKPPATGSVTPAKTIGTVLVSSWSANSGTAPTSRMPESG